MKGLSGVAPAFWARSRKYLPILPVGVHLVGLVPGECRQLRRLDGGDPAIDVDPCRDRLFDRRGHRNPVDGMKNDRVIGFGRDRVLKHARLSRGVELGRKHRIFHAGCFELRLEQAVTDHLKIVAHPCSQIENPIGTAVLSHSQTSVRVPLDTFRIDVRLDLRPVGLGDEGWPTAISLLRERRSRQGQENGQRQKVSEHGSLHDIIEPRGQPRVAAGWFEVFVIVKTEHRLDVRLAKSSFGMNPS